MKTFLTIVAVACVGRLTLDCGVSGNPIGEDRLSSEEIARRLSAAEFTPEQTLALIRKQQHLSDRHPIYKGLITVYGFLDIADNPSCEESALEGAKRFANDFQTWYKYDDSQLHRNLVSFARFYVAKRVEDCAGQKQPN